VTWQEPAARVHDPEPENDPALSLVKLTGPVGVLAAPAVVSLTLAVQIVA
jgi:hypothetical protein